MTKRCRFIIFISVLSILFAVWVITPWEDDADDQRHWDMRCALSVKLTSYNSLHAGLESFKVDIGRYPTNDEGIMALIVCPASIPKKLWRDTYAHVVVDPWGKEFRYIYTPEKPHGLAYEIVSAGKDGRWETEDDITNFDKKVPSCYNDPFLKTLHSGFHQLIFPKNRR